MRLSVGTDRSLSAMGSSLNFQKPARKKWKSGPASAAVQTMNFQPVDKLEDCLVYHRCRLNGILKKGDSTSCLARPLPNAKGDMTEDDAYPCVGENDD